MSCDWPSRWRRSATWRSERQRREHSYFEAFQSLADGVIAADLAGGVVFMNPAAARVTGWSPEEVTGRSLNEVFNIYQASGEPAEILPADAAAQATERTVYLTTRAGERVPIQDRTAPLRDEQGELTGLIILFRAHAPASVPPTAPTRSSAPLGRCRGEHFRSALCPRFALARDVCQRQRPAAL
jgi:two-component system cell cycle sensor histidine kinase/response regulator CckA